MRLYEGLLFISNVGVAFAAVFVFPVFELPAPTGAYDVGTEVFHFVDVDREEIFTDNVDDKRALIVQVWYPAEAISGRGVPFMEDDRLLNAMASGYGLPGFSFNHLKYVYSHAYREAVISKAQSAYPLIIMNHGFGSSKSLHTSQAENLASHGYIVASIDHTYNTFGTLFPDGKLTANDTSDLFSTSNDYETENGNRNIVGKVLTDDVAFVLDQFEAINSGHILSNLNGKLDMTNVGTIGHSIGGATAYDAAFDERITTGVNLDGGLYRINANEGLNKPFLFMLSESGFESRHLREITGSSSSEVIKFYPEIMDVTSTFLDISK